MQASPFQPVQLFPESIFINAPLTLGLHLRPNKIWYVSRSLAEPTVSFTDRKKEEEKREKKSINKIYFIKFYAFFER